MNTQICFGGLTVVHHHNPSMEKDLLCEKCGRGNSDNFESYNSGYKRVPAAQLSPERCAQKIDVVLGESDDDDNDAEDRNVFGKRSKENKSRNMAGTSEGLVLCKNNRFKPKVKGGTSESDVYCYGATHRCVSICRPEITDSIVFVPTENEEWQCGRCTLQKK
eukprot:Selendium_serpulae@DN5139_c0_g1_i12.p2